MKRLALLLLCAAGCGGPAQETRKDPVPAPAPAAVVIQTPLADEVAVEYRAQAEGQALIDRDTAPMTVKAQPDHWYAIAARLPSGTAREAKVQARGGQIASLRFTDAAPQGPQAMSREAFKGFVQTMDEEAGDQAKLNLLRSAASHQWFTSAMAGVLIDHVVHRENKLVAVQILKDRILDRENAFWLYQHFTYREDKARVQEMLER